MYAVIKTGGKQYRVAEGQRLDVERLAPRRDVEAPRGDVEAPKGDVEAPPEGELRFEPVLLVDGESVTAGAGALSGAAVTARVVGSTLGPKVVGFHYKNKSNQRKHWGHRQQYTTIEITGIRGPGSQEG